MAPPDIGTFVALLALGAAVTIVIRRLMGPEKSWFAVIVGMLMVAGAFAGAGLSEPWQQRLYENQQCDCFTGPVALSRVRCRDWARCAGWAGMHGGWAKRNG